MDINSGQRPRQKTVQTPVVTSQPTSNGTISGRSHRPKKRLFIIIGIVIALALIVGIYCMVAKPFGTEKAINKSGYQAVFLSNNQVYFGRLEQAGHASFVLKDVYYLQVQQPVQPQKSDSTQPSSQQASLSKLGSEVHGPEDTMYINNEHVLFWENLKDDGKVVRAIKENQNK